MKRNSIFTLAALALIACTAACNQKEEATTPPVQTAAAQGPKDAPPPAPTLTDQDKALASDLVTSHFLKGSLFWGEKLNTSDCSAMTSVLNKINGMGTVPNPDGGTLTFKTGQSQCDTSGGHYSANTSLDFTYSNYVYATPQGTHVTINGVFHVAYKYSDGDLRYTVSSSGLSIDGKPYDMEQVSYSGDAEPETQCNGNLKVAGVEGEVSGDCNSVKFN